MNLLQNIINNYTFLKNDFIGITINIYGITQFIVTFLIAIGVLAILYALGEKIRIVFFREIKQLAFFISIALGYFVIGTGVAILGFFSLLQPHILSLYLISLIVITVYPLSRINLNNLRSYLSIKRVKDILNSRKNFVMLGIFLFVGIFFLRLLTPEIAEDAYHTDLPLLYLSSHTTIHETKDPLHVIPYPQLAEMIYLIPLFLGQKEATRAIHFAFCVLVILLLFTIAKNRKSSFAKLAPLLFVTAPIVIKYASSQYIDFFMVFTFLLSVLLIERGASKNRIILSGIIFGAAMATKLWIMIYMPAILIYIIILNRKAKVTTLMKLLSIFIGVSLLTSIIWYLRDYKITGNPIYPLFSKPEYLETNPITSPSPMTYFGINWRMFTYDNISVLSPLFFLGAVFCLIHFHKVLKKIRQSTLFLFFIIITIEQLMISIYLGRHLLAWYTILTIIISAGMVITLAKHKLAQYAFILFYCLIFFYYFINTIIALPYGFGWADKNKYLTRILARDNASYYDFDHLFDKWISNKDIVATYGIYSYYYASFSYIDINYIFTKQNRSFNLLKEKGVTKLLIKGGDIDWFCKTLSLSDCELNNVQLLATYPSDVKKYNLYTLRVGR